MLVSTAEQFGSGKYKDRQQLADLPFNSLDSLALEPCDEGRPLSGHLLPTSAPHRRFPDSASSATLVKALLRSCPSRKET